MGIFFFFSLNLSKKIRTLKTVVYFTKSALSSQNFQNKHFKNTPQFEIIKYPDGNKQTEAWLFRANDSVSKSAIIMSPGTGLSIKNKILIIQAADGLRKAGVTVLIPFPDDLLNDITTEEAVIGFKNAFKFMENQPNIDSNKIGYLGFCGGSMVALIAAANPEISDHVSFVANISSWGNTLDFFAEVIANRTMEPGSRIWRPNKVSYKLTIKNILYRLDSEKDRQILTEYFLDSYPKKVDTAALTPQGQIVFDILKSKNLDYIREKLPNVSPRYKKDFDLLIPVNFIDDIKAPVYMMHDKDDNIIPVEDSERLSANFGPRATFVKTSILNHTILSDQIPLRKWLVEGPKIIHFLYKVFSYTS